MSTKKGYNLRHKSKAKSRRRKSHQRRKSSTKISRQSTHKSRRRKKSNLRRKSKAQLAAKSKSRSQYFKQSRGFITEVPDVSSLKDIYGPGNLSRSESSDVGASASITDLSELPDELINIILQKNLVVELELAPSLYDIYRSLVFREYLDLFTQYRSYRSISKNISQALVSIRANYKSQSIAGINPHNAVLNDAFWAQIQVWSRDTDLFVELKKITIVDEEESLQKLLSINFFTHKLIKLTTLIISRNYLDLSGSVALAISLGELTQLTTLEINENQLEYDAEDLARSLVKLTQLTALDISDNNFGPTGAIALAQSLGTLKQLTTLNITGNGIGPKGAIALAPSLGELTNLTHLALVFNDITFKGAIALVKSLIGLTKLETLDISGNDITDEEGEDLSNGLCYYNVRVIY